jgi:hypothetical protein
LPTKNEPANTSRLEIYLCVWPYDIYSFVDVAPLLASKGYHVFVPYLRGYGTTRFLSDDTFRNGQPSVVAVDIINFMDALKIDKAIIAGFDLCSNANVLTRLHIMKTAQAGDSLQRDGGAMPDLDGAIGWPR